jgi:hypothetical protein
MILQTVNAESLENLPEAICIASSLQELAIYRGKPLEIVRTMAREMGVGVSPREAIMHLIRGLGENRRIAIELPLDLDEDSLSRMFVYALVSTGVGRPLAQA